MPKIKPVMAWGLVDINGDLHLLAHATRKLAKADRFGHERVVRVRISVVPKRKVKK